VQHKLGVASAGAFDLGAACSGFIYGIATANGYIQSGLADNVLLIAAETRTRFINYNDRNTAVLYGDGAGAVILSETERQDAGLIQLKIGADGKGNEAISIPAGGSRMPASQQTVEQALHCMHFKEGIGLVKHAARCITDLIRKTLHQAGTTADEIDLIIPHQMNLRIIEIVSKKTGIPIEKFYVNIDKCGNTSAASIPIALDEALKQDKIHSGNLVLFVAFGAGFAWGSTLIRW
jgi:3-oxoacyl-[acyl-carrier-protein] synthase III